MPLTSAQLTALKTDIAANTNTIPAGRPFAGTQIKNLASGPDQNVEISLWYNLTSSPDWTVWKTNVSISDIGKKFNGSELAGLSTANQTRLQTVALFSALGVNPSLADQRAFFDDIFSGAGGTNTRASLLVLWKRLARNIEKLLSTGTGSDASPATLTFEGTITAADVEAARNS